jgi:hypothetical protein
MCGHRTAGGSDDHHREEAPAACRSAQTQASRLTPPAIRVSRRWLNARFARHQCETVSLMAGRAASPPSAAHVRVPIGRCRYGMRSREMCTSRHCTTSGCDPGRPGHTSRSGGHTTSETGARRNTSRGAASYASHGNGAGGRHETQSRSRAVFATATCSDGHAPAIAETDAELTLPMDHPVEAGQ